VAFQANTSGSTWCPGCDFDNNQQARFADLAKPCETDLREQAGIVIDKNLL